MITFPRQFLLAGRLLAVLLVICGVLVVPAMAAAGQCGCNKGVMKAVDSGMACCKAIGGEGNGAGDTGGTEKGCCGSNHCMCCNFSMLRVMDAGDTPVMVLETEVWMGVRAEGLAGVAVSQVSDLLRPPRC